MKISKEFKFEASHILPKHPGKCSRLHGHSWVLVVSVSGRINKETGFVMDYADLSTIVKPLIEDLDHRHLGAWTDLFYKPLPACYKDMLVPGLPEDFYPSSENLLWWIGDKLDKKGLRWDTLTLNETCTSSAQLGWHEFPAEKVNRLP